MNLLSYFRRAARLGSPRRSHDARHGFTMVEMLTVAVVMGTLVRMAVPNLHGLLLRARAAEVMGDFDVVRLAAENYHAKHLQWPADTYTGQVPPGMEEFLPEGFSFFRMGYSIDWENWVLPSGLPQSPGTKKLLAISIVTDDRALGQALVDVLGGAMAYYVLSDSYTFVVERY